MSYLQDQAMAAAGYKKSGKDQEAALDKALKSADYLASRGADGIAALCSRDGRHLAMMPHPERCFQSWQWPWRPAEWEGFESGPWLKLFHNARSFCDRTTA